MSKFLSNDECSRYVPFTHANVYSPPPPQILSDKLKEIYDSKTFSEQTLPKSHAPSTIRRAGDYAKGPQRHDPTRASLQRGLLPRASGSKRRRAHLDAAVVVPPPRVARKRTVSTFQSVSNSIQRYFQLSMTRIRPRPKELPDDQRLGSEDEQRRTALGQSTVIQ